MARQTVRLVFPEEHIREPVIYRLGREFAVVPNIFRAAVTEKEAWVVLELEGEEAEIARARASLEEMGIRVEPWSEPGPA